jgi:anaerobic magnesium-protoporphyrin IX monomethyl ester cyclase
MGKEIVFYQQYPLPYFGVISLTSYLRQHGHEADIVIDALEKDPVAALKRLDPRVIGISVTSVEHSWLAKRVSRIRREIPGARIIVGGIHGILYPDEILRDTGVELVCNSEGEYVLLEVLREIQKSDPDWSRIKGISYRDRDGAIKTNQRARLFSYEGAAIEDSAVYYQRYPVLSEDKALRFISGRGCPYECSFCYNATIKEIFRGQGPYVRQKEAPLFLEEIRLLVQRHYPKSIFFADDLFTMNKAWLRLFLKQYKETVRIPFMCFTRANLVDEETATLLAEAGCRTAGFGIETGSYRLRKDVLRKDISDETILAAAAMLKARGIRVQTANMFCLPDETPGDAHQTIALNIKSRADFAFSSLFLPFPKLEITDYCIRKGYLKPGFSLMDIPNSFMLTSVLALPEKTAIINIQRMSFFFIRFPSFYKIARWLADWKLCTPLCYWFYLAGNVVRHKEERGISLFEAFRYAWRMRRHF